MKKLIIAGLSGVLLLAGGLYSVQETGAQTDADSDNRCTQLGGTVYPAADIARDLDGAQIRTCRFPAPDSRYDACQTWDLYYGRCPGRPAAFAVTDINGVLLRDGDLIRRADDPDIFIIRFGHWPGGSTIGFKRLFLNPAIFSFYGHLGGYGSVKTVSERVFNLFEVSGLFRNCESNDRRVWATEVTGEDVGVLHHVQMSGDAAVAEDHRFFERVFCINTREANWYARSIYPYTRLADIPDYSRPRPVPSCQPRPACLDSEPRCLLPEPSGGWCPRPCAPLPACALPGANPVCALAPAGSGGRPWCPAPGGTGQVTVENVSVEQAGLVPPDWNAVVSGYLPTPCYSLSNVTVSQSGNEFHVSLSASVTADICVQTIQKFTRSVRLASGVRLDGTYHVFVNGRFMTSFTATGTGSI
ncbi:MAG TPA: hypothetical protein VD862_02615 [Candidatus Paceibacterota bacterium]|nr:hypothetical protein [Candidatus Paceibacterota bacterium]